MPIAINGSGTITGISVGGIPDGTVDTDVLAANAVTYAKIGTTEQGQLCKAWVNFDGTGTPSIRASYNVSSITDNGTGDYTVNFTSALADANYTMTSSSANTTPTMSIAHPKLTASPFTASSALVETRRTDTGASLDCQFVCLSFFR